MSEAPVTTAWTNGGIEDPEDYCDVAVPWCTRPYRHAGACDVTPTRTETANA